MTLTYEEIEQATKHFLRENYLMSLATVASDMRPSVSVMVYVLDEDFHFYFVTHMDARKVRNLIQNPRVGLVIWQNGQKMLVQAEGTASVVDDASTRDWAMDRFADITTNDTQFWPPILRMQGKEYQVFRVTADWVRTLDMTRGTVSQEESPFTEIHL